MTISLRHCKVCLKMKRPEEMAKDKRPKLDGSPSYYRTCRECKLAKDRERVALYKKTCAICEKEKATGNFSVEHPTWCNSCAAGRNVNNRSAAKALAMRW